MRIGCNFCFRRWICRALRDRQIQSQGCKPKGLQVAEAFLTIKDRQKRLGDKFCRRQNFLVSCTCIRGHLRPCKLPWMRVQLPWLAGFLIALHSGEGPAASCLRRMRRGRCPVLFRAGLVGQHVLHDLQTLLVGDGGQRFVDLRGQFAALGYADGDGGVRRVGLKALSVGKLHVGEVGVRWRTALSAPGRSEM